MKDLGITKGEWRFDTDGHHYVVNAPDDNICACIILDDEVDEQTANGKLISDAGNTAQKCGLLPSELLKQRDEFKNLLIEMVDELEDHYVLGDEPFYAKLEEANALIKKAEQC